MLQSFLKPLYHDIKTLVLDTLFPIYCLVCETEGIKFICNDCQNKLTPLDHQFCIVCQKPSLGGLTHPKCQSPFTADGLISIFDYHDEKAADILIKGKYSFLPRVYEELGVMIANAIKTDFPYLLSPKPSRLQSPDAPADGGQVALSPIPLHKWRQRWRGFNQAKILAESIGKNLGLPIADVLARKKFTKTQKNLKKADRIKNLESAFALSPKFLNLKSPPDFATTKSLRAGEIQNHQFVLVDDVTTTGSTLLEAAKVLKRNGAAKVICLTVARD